MNLDLPAFPSFIIHKPELPLGDVLVAMQRKFPPFNFYADKPEHLHENDYLFSRKPVPFQYYFEYGQVKRWFLNVISQAQQDAWNGNTEKAIWYYETLMEHRYPNYKPYDLLIALYKKQKDLDNEIRVLKHSIAFFESVRAEQREYVLGLASDVGMSHKAVEYIEAGKKIQYYGGGFVLYDPVKRLEVWVERLEKIKLLSV